jgi:hypothetical protein
MKRFEHEIAEHEEFLSIHGAGGDFMRENPRN